MVLQLGELAVESRYTDTKPMRSQLAVTSSVIDCVQDNIDFERMQLLAQTPVFGNGRAACELGRSCLDNLQRQVANGNTVA